MAVKRFRSRKIGEILGPTSDYTQYEVPEKTKVQDVAKQLEQNAYHMVTVVDKNRIPVGLVTQTDLVRKIGSGINLGPSQEVEDVINRDFMRVSEDASIDAALNLMNASNVNKLVIVRTDGTFRGVIHKSDIARAVQRLL